MNSQSLQHTVQITNPQGFHLRPMGAFAQLASRFKCKVTVSWDGRTGDGKSIMELLALAAPAGSTFTLAVEGPDAPDALNALVALLEAPAPDEVAEPPRA